MLVLSRKKGESILIQDNIEITILEVNADTVKIGIQAPRDVDILRKELLVSVTETNRDAVISSSINLKSVKEMMDENKNNEKKR